MRAAHKSHRYNLKHTFRSKYVRTDKICVAQDCVSPRALSIEVHIVGRRGVLVDVAIVSEAHCDRVYANGKEDKGIEIRVIN